MVDSQKSLGQRVQLCEKVLACIARRDMEDLRGEDEPVDSVHDEGSNQPHCPSMQVNRWVERRRRFTDLPQSVPESYRTMQRVADVNASVTTLSKNNGTIAGYC
jgi:hypothetical protein